MHVHATDISTLEPRFSYTTEPSHQETAAATTGPENESSPVPGSFLNLLLSTNPMSVLPTAWIPKSCEFTLLIFVTVVFYQLTLASSPLFLCISCCASSCLQSDFSLLHLDTVTVVEVASFLSYC